MLLTPFGVGEAPYTEVIVGMMSSLTSEEKLERNKKKTQALSTNVVQ